MKKTPLHDRHTQLNAQMTDFAGFEMPVRYSSDKAEHLAVRKHVGLFDVSHMGEIFIRGPKATEAVDFLLTNDASSMVDGQAFYAGMLNEKGTFIDDVVAYRFSPEKFLICVNASNREKDAHWIFKKVTSKFSLSEAKVLDESDDWAQIAVQGPNAVELVSRLCKESVSHIQRYHFAMLTLRSSVSMIVARTGYTGEDGFELFIPSEHAVWVWDTLLKNGESLGVLPCGLAARDTLRLEAGMCLYGNDIDETTTPLEAGISWAVKLDKTTDFIGKQALQDQKRNTITKRLCGLELQEPGIARHGYRVLSKEEQPIGTITSGTLTPFLNKAIAMAYINKPYFEPGTEVYVDVRGRPARAKIVKLPFYKRQGA